MRLLAVAAAVMLVAGPSLGVIPPAAVTARASSGQVYEGFIVDPGDVHSFLLEDFAPQVVSISLKAGRGSDLLPDIALFDPAEDDVTGDLIDFRKDGAKSVAVKNATAIALPGPYTLQVKGRTGSTGSYLLKVTAKVTKSFRNTGLVSSPGTDSFDVFAPTEALVTLKVVKGAASTLTPKFIGVSGPPCSAAALVPSVKAGVATFVSPVTGTWSVEIGGDGGTGGPFNWSAKVKPVKPSRKPIRVNGGAPFFAAPGPSPGIRTASVGQDVSGFAVDALDICWREIRTKGGGPKQDKNTVQCTTVKGLDPRNLANDFATDAAPDPRTFALGPTHAAAFAGGDIFAIPRNGSGEALLFSPLDPVNRILADREYAYSLVSSGILRHNLDASDSAGVFTNPTYVYLDMALGGKGVVFAGTDAGDLVIATVDRDGNGFLPLATLTPGPALQGIAARGPDAYFAVGNGAGGASLYRASTCDPGTAVPLCPDFVGPVTAMAADDQNVYAIENDTTDIDGGRVRLRQIPRGGGESIVLYRGNSSSFTITPDGLGAAGGYVFVQTDDGGTPAFYRVKRR